LARLIALTVMPMPGSRRLDVKWRQGSVMPMKLTAVFEKVPEGYIAFVEELPGANTQGVTIEEARSNLQEAVELVLEANRVLAEEALNGRSVIREPFVIVSR
jgi:predicted RNase H-like HicB family nuclease